LATSLILTCVTSPYANALAYLQRIGARDGYRRAMERGDPGMTPMLT